MRVHCTRQIKKGQISKIKYAALEKGYSEKDVRELQKNTFPTIKCSVSLL